MHQDKLLFWQAKQEVDKSWTKPDADTPTFASVAAAAQPNKENLELKVELAKAKSMNEQLQATIDSIHEWSDVFYREPLCIS